MIVLLAGCVLDGWKYQFDVKNTHTHTTWPGVDKIVLVGSS